MKKIFTLAYLAFTLGLTTTALPTPTLMGTHSSATVQTTTTAADEASPTFVHETTASNGLTLKSTHKYASVSDADVVEFGVFYNGEDVTSQAKVYYLNLANFAATIVPDGKHIFEEPGSYVFWAEYGELSSKNKTLTIVAYHDVPTLPTDAAPDSLDFERRVLLVQNTGTNCGYCPNAITAIHNFKDKSPNADKLELLAAHAYNSSDPLYSSAAVTIFRMTGFNSFPSIMFNFDKNYALAGTSASYFESYINNTTETLLQKKSSTGIALTTKYNDETGTISVKAGIKTDSAGIYKITIALVQDNVYAYQGGADPSDERFHIHKAGVKAIYPSSGAGEKINGNIPSVKGKVYEYCSEFSSDLLSPGVGGGYTLDVLRDARIIAYVTNESGIVDNVASCNINAQQPFAYTHAEATSIHAVSTNNAAVRQTIIYDLTGKPVCTLKGGDYKSAPLPRGIYIAHLRTDKGARTVKFVKQ